MARLGIGCRLDRSVRLDAANEFRRVGVGNRRHGNGNGFYVLSSHSQAYEHQTDHPGKSDENDSLPRVFHFLSFASLRVKGKSAPPRQSEEHTSELQSPCNLVCRLLLE